MKCLWASKVKRRLLSLRSDRSSEELSAELTPAPSEISKDYELDLFEGKCPAPEEFATEVNALMSQDLIEGCRLILKTGAVTSSGQYGASHILNLGTYQPAGSQADLVRALLSSCGSVPAKGGYKWISCARYTSPNGSSSIQGRYFSNAQCEARFVSKLSEKTVLRMTGVAGSLGSLLNYGRRAAWAEPAPVSGMVALERSSAAHSMTAQVSFRDGWASTIGYASRLAQNIWGGVECTFLQPSGAVLRYCGLRVKPNDHATVTAGITATPNFEKAEAEGLNETMLIPKLSVAWRLNPRLTIATEAEAELKTNKTPLARLAYEYRFPTARVCAHIDSTGKIEQTVLDASGLQLTGSLDFANDNYKVGFGFEGGNE